MELTIAVVIILVNMGVTIGFSYLMEKGKNIATKEDIEDITDKVESVRLESAQKLESLKSSLVYRINLNSFRYEQEYKILQELTEKLVKVHHAARSLRPPFDVHSRGEDEDERKRKRLGDFNCAWRDLNKVVEMKKPFYASEIYNVVEEFREVVWSEAVAYKHSDLQVDGNSSEYWDEAKSNLEKIVDISQRAINAIRLRVVSWEDISR